MCSLKETGFRGKHKCGVTLLSGGKLSFFKSEMADFIMLYLRDTNLTKLTLQNKWHSLFCTGKPSKNGSFYEEHKDDPTIFVGAAHCNFVCKDFTDRDHPVALETCCCLPKELSTSCVRGSEVGYKEP